MWTLRSTTTPSNGARKVTLPQGFSFSLRGPTLPALASLCDGFLGAVGSFPPWRVRALHPSALRRLEPRVLVGTDLLGLGMKRVDLVLGDVPHLEVVEGPVDVVAVSLHGTDLA